jgi:uncharacterized membrane protein
MDGTKRHAGAMDKIDEIPPTTPANQAVIVEAPAVSRETAADAAESEVSVEAPPAAEVIAAPEIAESEPMEEVEPVAADDPVADSLTADPEDLQALLEQFQSADLAEPSGKRRLSAFQSLIIVLLVVFVILVLAMVFLYASGMIELPPAMMNVIDKGLELVQ